jgi:hypothetical protein
MRLHVSIPPGVHSLLLTYPLLVTSSYLQAHNMIRGITGYGEGNGPYIAISDGFLPLTEWANLISGSDRIALDTHPYFSFDGQPNTQPIAADDGLGEPGGVWPKQACGWGPGINNRSGVLAYLANQTLNRFTRQSTRLRSDHLR